MNPASPTLFTEAYTYFNSQLNMFLTQRYGDVVDAVRGPLLAGLVIYLALYGYAIMRGAVQEPITDFVYRGVKLAIIFTAATTVAYQEWITGPLFNDAPSAVTEAISGKEYGQMGMVFDALEAQSIDVSNRLQAAADIMGITQAPRAIMYYILSFIVRLFAEIAACVGFGVSMLALISLAIIIAMGPIFIALALFDWGKRYFNGWLNQAFNYIVLLAIITTMASLITDLGEKVLGQMNLEDDISAALLYIGFYGLGTFFFFQAPSIASGITGGAAAGASDLVGNVARAASKPWLPSRGGGGGGGRGGGGRGAGGGTITKR
ncbi:type IV secretion system protein [Sphingomonas prati]|uniref:Type IV secretion system protein VirB6 n=1 Tax=Sphingomonas prati TaxID=1843237 RepID=A0A7W9BWE9_9SPHN|nr:type IV secretion system protein [Sphingomonas prati]MBB5730898.1 type IV secretion system protein VirB6 [Sphingomonas prati]GGE97637.1 type IV secretion protein AvhB6 [Sphingomonas prati]